MRRYLWIGIVLLAAGLPAPGQEIIQRMERDVLAPATPEQLAEAPLLTADDLKKIALFSRFGKELRSEESGILRRVAMRLSQGAYAAAQKDWQLALGKMKEREFAPDVDALVHGVLQQAYLEKDVKLRPLAAAVPFREEQREAAHKERDRMQRQKTAFDEGKASPDLRIRRLILPEKLAPGVHPVAWTDSEPATADVVSSELQKLVALSNAADDNAKKALLDLQKALEGQTLQTMSNASAMLHDTAKSVINNLKA